MQSDPRFFARKANRTDEMDGYGLTAAAGDYYTYGVATEPPFDATLPGAGRNHGYPGPLNSVEFQTAELCPKNYIIFDQTEKKSRIMFHPAFAQKFNYPSFDIPAVHAQESDRDHGKYIDNHDKSSSLEEDSDGIDALLSLEADDEEEEDEDEVVSTGRTPGNYGIGSPDSLCSTDGSRSTKIMRSTSAQNSASGSGSSKRKERMRKMVKALRGIIPGGDQMDTPAILDEAVRYLKSLKVEVKKLGIQNLKN